MSCALHMYAVINYSTPWSGFYERYRTPRYQRMGHGAINTFSALHPRDCVTVQLLRRGRVWLSTQSLLHLCLPRCFRPRRLVTFCWSIDSFSVSVHRLPSSDARCSVHAACEAFAAKFSTPLETLAFRSSPWKTYRMGEATRLCARA